MWTELAYPTKTLHAVKIPTRVAPAALDHPPPLVKVKRTSEALPPGEVVHNVTTIASQAAQWIESMMPSRIGNFLVTTLRCQRDPRRPSLALETVCSQ